MIASEIRNGKVLPGLVMLLVMVLLLTVIPVDAGASEITMHVRPGLGGLYKQSLPVELTVLINNEGPAVRGNIKVAGDPTREEFRWQRELQNTYVTDVEIAANGKTQVSLVVPGIVAAASPSVVLTVDGLVVSKTVVHGAAVQGSQVVLSLGSDSVQGPLTDWLNQRFGTVALKNLPLEELPASALLLRFVDLIVLQPDVVAGLSQDQIRVLRDWTALGGTLILSAGAGAERDGPLADLSPVAVIERKIVNPGQSGIWTGEQNPTAAVGDLVTGRVLVRQGDLIIVAGHSIGRGTVVFTALPVQGLNLETDKQWEQLLLKSVESGFQGGIASNLASASSYLPQLKMPTAISLAVIWGLYALLVGPGLYLLLRRLDKRELAWLLVPAAAVLTAAGLYFTGPLQRLPGPLVQTLATVDLLGQDLAEVNAGVAVVSPRGGDLKLLGPEGGIMQPHAIHGYGHNQGQGQGILINTSGPGQEVFYPKVEYQSIRHAYAQSIWQGVPGLATSLSINERDRLQGKVSNLTGRDLRDCVLLVGNDIVTLGFLAAGETVEVDYRLVTGDDLEPGYPRQPVELLFPYPNRPGNDNFARERQMMNSLLEPFYAHKEMVARPDGAMVRDATVNVTSHKSNLAWQGQIHFFGWSDEPTGLFELKEQGRKVEHSLVLYRQQLELELPTSGPVYLPTGFVPFDIIGGEGGWEARWGSLIMHHGKVELRYIMAMPEPAQFRLQSVIFPDQWWVMGVKLSLQNTQDQSWHPVPPGTTLMTANELAPYLTGAGELRVQINGTDHQKHPIRVRGLGMEGVMGQ